MIDLIYNKYELQVENKVDTTGKAEAQANTENLYKNKEAIQVNNNTFII